MVVVLKMREKNAAREGGILEKIPGLMRKGRTHLHPRKTIGFTRILLAGLRRKGLNSHTKIMIHSNSFSFKNLVVGSQPL